MNAKIALSTLVLAAFAGSAFAEAPIEGNEVFATGGGKARAEVQAELAAYKAAGVNPWSWYYNPLKTFQGTRTRAEVTAEFLGAREEVRAMGGEDSGSAYLAQQRGRQVPPTYAGTPRNAQ